MKQIKFFIFVFLFYFLFLNSYGLIDPDEPRYATTAKNMVISGEFIVPEFNGDIRINKPPLTYWLIAISYKIFGINEFAARLPHAFFGFLLGIILFIFLKENFSEDLRIIPTAILYSTPFYIFFSRLCNTDMILNFFFSLSLLSFFNYYKKNNKKSLVIFLLSYLFTNLAKGPVAFLIPLIIFIFFISERDLKFLKKISIILIIIVFSLSSLIWLMIVAVKTGNINTMKTLIFNETLGRVFKGYAHREPFYFYLVYFPLLFLPWSIFFILKFYNVKKIFKNKFLKFNVIWFFTIFIFFSISKSKLVSYILPLSIPFSIICAEILKNYNFTKFNFKKSFFILSIFLIALSLYLIYIHEFELNLYVLVFTILTFFTYFYFKEHNKIVQISILSIFFITGILTISGKFITDLKTEKFLKEIEFPKEFQIVVFRKKLTGCAFYKGNYKKIDSIADILKYKENKNMFILTSVGMYERYLKNSMTGLKIIFKTKGRILLK